MSPASTSNNATDGSRRRFRRAAGLVLGLLGFVVIATGCLPPLLDPPTSGKSYGKGPLDSIREAAEIHAGCGLSSTDLAAMMMVPTYFEAGGPIPSPMALSRWDNVAVRPENVNLFAFRQTSGAYVNAFFSPGIGLWQFDSAGGWDMTAADAIDTATAANQAADTIAWRWCNAPDSKQETAEARRAYAWGPWYGCSFSNQAACENLFNSLSTDGSLNTAFDASVSRTGGMIRRTCNLIGIGNGLDCWYINPANAEGSRAWTGGTYDGRTNYVTPLPKPFYSLRANGREYRVWLKEDTGYDINITASKPVTSSARTSLTWESTTGLCDVTTGHGLCNPPRVATTPWGPVTGNPIGNFESAVTSGIGRIAVGGWSVDPDTNDPVAIHVYINGAWGGALIANVPRPDVASAIPGYGNLRGFSSAFEVSPGVHSVCAFALNVSPYGDTNPNLGCRSVTVSGDPVGSLDGATAVLGGIRVSGWAIDPDTASPVPVKVSVDGVVVAEATASESRPDVASVFPRYGAGHGYSVFVATIGGSRRVCVEAINQPPSGTVNRSLGCAVVVVSGQVFGNVETIIGGPGGVFVSGWAIDPDTGDSIVRVTLDGATVDLPTAKPRPDVTGAFPVFTGPHGFEKLIPAAGGTRRVCVTLLNQGATGTDQPAVCRSVAVLSGNPFGNLENAARTGTGISLSGWALDPDVAGPVSIHIYVNGAWGGSFAAERQRGDVGAAFPGYGSARGFVIPLSAGQAPVSVCAYLINQGPGSTNPLLGCRSL
jgi:hypothetical protein